MPNDAEWFALDNDLRNIEDEPELPGTSGVTG